ncbi:PREDICTED: nucleolar transcription factor 1-B-like [Ipomoea nil]|uniref:nucleolar transcription factor 1-B-like n=1 Tax=Ipomoea nil TaxID=35883 RepID=UPI00090156F7|nr:PREDICTED: nucleolar transcription factor 1-B-like [Ipomoea nil]
MKVKIGEVWSGEEDDVVGDGRAEKKGRWLLLVRMKVEGKSYEISTYKVNSEWYGCSFDIVKPSYDDPIFETEMKNLRDVIHLSKIKTELEKLYKNDPHCSTSGTKHVPPPADTRDVQVSKENDSEIEIVGTGTNEKDNEDKDTEENDEEEEIDEPHEKNDGDYKKDDDEEDRDDDEDDETDEMSEGDDDGDNDNDNDKGDDNDEDGDHNDLNEEAGTNTNASSSDDGSNDDEPPVIGQTRMIPVTPRKSNH